LRDACTRIDDVLEQVVEVASIRARQVGAGMPALSPQGMTG
jgi:hypothetical protein